MGDIDHRALGVQLYNTTWDLLERSGRTPEDDDEMLARAHASLYHWGQFDGVQPENVGRGHWLVSRVHAVLGQADSAAYHAARYVTIARGGAGEGWDLAAALEASARAAAVGGDFDAAERFEAEARDVLGSLEDPEDREVVEADLTTLPRRP